MTIVTHLRTEDDGEIRLEGVPSGGNLLSLSAGGRRNRVDGNGVLDGTVTAWTILTPGEMRELVELAERGNITPKPSSTTPSVDKLCSLIYDLYGRSGVDYAIDACREHMDPEDVELLDSALERGGELA